MMFVRRKDALVRLFGARQSVLQHTEQWMVDGVRPQMGQSEFVMTYVTGGREDAGLCRHQQKEQQQGAGSRWISVGGMMKSLSYHKATTGIVGMPLDEQSREHLKEKLTTILNALEAHGIPASAAYRRGIEERCREKLTALSSLETSDEELERLFGRQLEQEIKMCDDELQLIPQMAQWKPWDGDHDISVVEDES